MSFYENNLQRVRSNIHGLFNSESESEGEDDGLVCSRKKKCDLKMKDMIEEDQPHVSETDTPPPLPPPTFGQMSLDLSEFEEEDATTPMFGQTSPLPEPDTSDSDEPESEKQEVDDLDDISESELERDIEHIKNVEKDLKIIKSSHYPDDSIPVEVENEETFLNNLIQHDLKENNIYIKVKEKPYKIEINSGNPDEEEEYIEPQRSIENKVNEVSHYKNFEAFYEQNIANFTKQLYIFNKIVCNNLITHPFLSDVVSEFRKHVVQVWLEKFTEADDKYNINFHEPKKWVQRAESLIFDVHSKQPVIEYVKVVGSLIVLFDVHQTYGLNEHLYKNILNKAVEPVDMKKYDINEFLVFFTRGKNISKVLIQDVKDSIMSRQNIEIINLDINLYNRIFHDTVKPMSPLAIDEDLVKKIADYFEHNDIHNLQDILKQPIIYVDPDTHKVYIFDYNKLNDNFNENKFVNTFTDKPFEEQFVEQCRKKMKNHLLCNYCKDNICDTTKTLKTVYQDPNYGPIVMKFCSVDCFSDIEWKPKVLRNAIV